MAEKPAKKVTKKAEKKVSFESKTVDDMVNILTEIMDDVKLSDDQKEKVEYMINAVNERKNKPKKPKNGYLIFCDDMRKELKEYEPTDEVMEQARKKQEEHKKEVTDWDGLLQTEKLGAIWSCLSEEEKNEYKKPEVKKHYKAIEDERKEEEVLERIKAKKNEKKIEVVNKEKSDSFNASMGEANVG